MMAVWNPRRYYSVANNIFNYNVVNKLPLPEYNATAILLKHQLTNSQHLHLKTKDNNNVFSIGFNTFTDNDMGLPHILEHTTLCGSKNYPIHDPFFKMLNKSVANFMNAMTGSHYTFYPFATTNRTDYKNLLDVYLDATLHPNLSYYDFIQEGWRLEHDNVRDKNSKLTFKGVVYNEMKGQVSNMDYYFYNQFIQKLFPDLNNSGGDPKRITDLKYQQLVDFHKQNYHPSNALTYSYGNFPLNDLLEKLNTEFSKFTPLTKTIKRIKGIELNQNVQIETEGHFDPSFPDDKQIKVSFTWDCGKGKNLYNNFLWKILSSLILDNQSSPFYQSLIESGLGTDFTVNTGFDNTVNNNSLTIGCQGINKDQINEVKKVIDKTFNDILMTPFDKLKVQSIIEQIELNKKDHKSNFGLRILYGVLPQWSIGSNPLDLLNLTVLLDRFKKDYTERGDKIFHELLLSNIIDKNTLQFVMEGDKEFSSKLQNEEDERLQNHVSSLKDGDKEAIYEKGLQLLTKQENNEDLSCLPSLAVKQDIARESPVYPIESKSNFVTRLTETNCITYLRGQINLNDIIPRELYPFLPIFTESLMNLGTKTQKFKDIETEIQFHTGGISASCNVMDNPFNLLPKIVMNFSGWSLNAKTDKIIEFWDKLILNTDFVANRETLKILIKMIASSSMSSISDSGHSLAMKYGGAHFSVSKSISETLSGLEQLQFINKLNKIIESEDEELFKTEIIDKLMQLQEIIKNCRNRINFFIISDSQEQISVVQGQINKFVEKFNGDKIDTAMITSEFPLIGHRDNITTKLLEFPFQTHFSSICQPSGINYLHQDSVPLMILSQILTFKYLHREIRERNGAYGSGMNYDSLNGILSSFSYRDPNPMNSLQVMESISENGKLINDIGKVDINDGKLRLFQSIDSPISKRNESLWYFNYGITDMMRQTRRSQIIDCQLNDLRRVFDKYLVNNLEKAKIIVGPPIHGAKLEIIKFLENY